MGLSTAMINSHDPQMKKDLEQWDELDLYDTLREMVDTWDAELDAKFDYIATFTYTAIEEELIRRGLPVPHYEPPNSVSNVSE